MPAKWKFSIAVAQAWEKALDDAETPGTRKVKMRSAMVMSPDRGGIFWTLLKLTQFGLGGRAASGRQYVSWVHYADFIRALEWIIQHDRVRGAINIASPNPIPQAELMRQLRHAWGMPIGLPASRWMLEIGAALLGTESELILKSRRVIPARLTEEGFVFAYPQWPQAVEQLCNEWREQ